MPLLNELQLALTILATRAIDILTHTPWTDWRGFWLTYVFDQRMLIAWFFPLVPILLLAPARHRRIAVILTGLAFVGYLWGVFHLCLWIAVCYAFFKLAESYACECRRTDVNPLGPPLVAGMAIVFALTAFFYLYQWIRLPPAVDQWLHAHAPWLYSIGTRGAPWESPNYPGPDPYRLFDLYNPYLAHVVGTAYLIVRLLHYFAEIRKGTIRDEHRSLGRFFAWVCYGPNLMQGPIERYHEFHTQLEHWHLQRSLAATLYGLWRIAMGISKSLISGLFFEPFISPPLVEGPYYRDPAQVQSDLFLYFGVFLQIFNLYIQFSGYCDISAGIASILGYRQVENFAMPWFATSLRDFWRRWHISLSLILRDYVYIPLGGSRTGVPVLNLMLTFGICGLWHAYLPQMWWWGVLMGAMLWVNQRWAEEMSRLDALNNTLPDEPQASARAAPPPDEPRASARAVAPTPIRVVAARIRAAWLKLAPLPTICAWLLTQHAFVFSLVIFFGGVGGVRVITELFARFLSKLLLTFQ